ncbi:hypothetical protein DFH27DRAFT_569183 [Peziza echinospora]|nr:hypothetical protein DFH27DRAFT_569183 [Peziza echinospora]
MVTSNGNYSGDRQDNCNNQLPPGWPWTSVYPTTYNQQQNGLQPMGSSSQNLRGAGYDNTLNPIHARLNQIVQPTEPPPAYDTLFGSDPTLLPRPRPQPQKLPHYLQGYDRLTAAKLPSGPSDGLRLSNHTHPPLNPPLNPPPNLPVHHAIPPVAPPSIPPPPPNNVVYRNHELLQGSTYLPPLKRPPMRSAADIAAALAEEENEKRLCAMRDAALASGDKYAAHAYITARLEDFAAKTGRGRSCPEPGGDSVAGGSNLDNVAHIDPLFPTTLAPNTTTMIDGVPWPPQLPNQAPHRSKKASSSSSHPAGQSKSSGLSYSWGVRWQKHQNNVATGGPPAVSSTGHGLRTNDIWNLPHPKRLVPQVLAPSALEAALDGGTHGHPPPLFPISSSTLSAFSSQAHDIPTFPSASRPTSRIQACGPIIRPPTVPDYSPFAPSANIPAFSPSHLHQKRRIPISAAMLTASGAGTGAGTNIPANPNALPFNAHTEALLKKHLDMAMGVDRPSSRGMKSVVAGSYFPPYPPLDDAGKVDDKGGGGGNVNVNSSRATSEVVRKDGNGVVTMKDGDGVGGGGGGGGAGVRVTVKAAPRSSSLDLGTNPMPSVSTTGTTTTKVAGHGLVVERDIATMGVDSVMLGARNSGRIPRL